MLNHCLVVMLALWVVAPLAAQLPWFRPFAEPGYGHVNAHQVSPDGRTLYLALFPARVAAEQGVPAPDDAPEILIYRAAANEDGTWSVPEPVSFAGAHKDYEPTLSPAGDLMLFNSWRPMPDSRAVNGKNNLWLSRLGADGTWSEPVIVDGVSRWETEESYPAITANGRVYYCQETAAESGGAADYDIYAGRLHGHRLVDVEPFAPAATSAGECDPWVSPDGSVLVFTRWQAGGDWNATVDLYVTFFREDAWSEPLRLPFNQQGQPDYSPAASADGETFYWRQSDGVRMIPMREIVDAVPPSSSGSSE